MKNSVPEKEGCILVKSGVRRYVLPIAAQVQVSPNYAFVSLPAVSGLYRIENGKGWKEMDAMDDASEASRELSEAAAPRRRGRPRAIRELPDALKEALKQIPDGYRIGYDPDGTPKLVRKRSRRKRKAAAEGGS